MEEIACGAIIFREKNNKVEYLIIQHRNDGHWFFPKGKMEENETKMQCAQREILEETGLENLRFIDNFEIEYYYQFLRGRQIVNKKVYFYIAEAGKNDKVRLSDEHQNYKWLGFTKAYNLLTHKKSKDSIKKVNGFLVQLRHK